MKTKLIYVYISVVLFAVILTSCTNELKIEDIGFEKSFSIAKKKYNNGNYLQALEDFNVLILNYGGQTGIDSVQYLLADTHFKLEEFYSSSYEFNRLTESFPESKLAEESYFNSAMSYYKLSPIYSLDQKETYNAISKFQFYLDLYPVGEFADKANRFISEMREKLARKEFESGKLYMKMDQPRAAKIYFLEVINNFYDTSYYSLSLKFMAEASELMKDEYNFQVYQKKYNETIKK
ncbi:MAG: outer membrane protein assembly factor BamD [Candidatus Delongbacteria bacterium]|jgi:outer membrane protein assembly factor BamD|nr:outer membrane protein assembly factor BamD [Candidatus Delongbacteria bacterium]